MLGGRRIIPRKSGDRGKGVDAYDAFLLGDGLVPDLLADLERELSEFGELVAVSETFDRVSHGEVA